MRETYGSAPRSPRRVSAGADRADDDLLRPGEHPGQEFIDAIERREVERLESIAEARKRPGSIWHDRPGLWDGTTHGPSDGSPPGVGRSRTPTRSLAGPVAVTLCQQCGQSLAGRRSDAKFCDSACKQRGYRRRRVPAASPGPVPEMAIMPIPAIVETAAVVVPV